MVALPLPLPFSIGTPATWSVQNLFSLWINIVKTGYFPLDSHNRDGIPNLLDVRFYVDF